MELRPGMVEPMFLHELALELGMSVSEIGQRMSAHELTVEWPAYFAARRAEQEKETRKQERL